MKKLCRKSGKVKFRSHEHALLRGGKILERSKYTNALTAYKCKFCGSYHLTSNILSARTLNRQQASLTERAGKLSLPVNQSVKGKAGLSAVSEAVIALFDSEGQGVKTLPPAQFENQPPQPDRV